MKVLPSILLKSVFSNSGLSCASRLRSSLVQMMKAFRGLLTRCGAGPHLASGLAQLESELTDSGLEGPELGERTSFICSPSAEPGSSHSGSWKRAGSWLMRMVTWGDDPRAAVILPAHSDVIYDRSANGMMGGVESKGVKTRCSHRSRDLPFHFKTLN